MIWLVTFDWQVKEYELSETFHHSEESSANEILKMEHISYVYEEGVGNTFIMKKNASSVNLKKVTTAAKIKPNSSATQRDAEVEEELAELEQAQKEEESKNNNLIAPMKEQLKTKTAEVVDVDDGVAVKQNLIDIYSKKRQQKLAGRKLNQRRLNNKKGHHHHHKKDVRKIRKFSISVWLWSSSAHSAHRICIPLALFKHQRHLPELSLF